MEPHHQIHLGEDILIVIIGTTFQVLYSLAFFSYLLLSVNFKEFQTAAFIPSTGIGSSYSEVHAIKLCFIKGSIACLRELVIFPNTIDFKAHRYELRDFSLTTHNSESFYLQLCGGLFLVLQDSWCLGLLDVWDEMA